MQPSAPKSEHPKTAESSAANTNSPANHGEKKRYQPRLAAASLPRETKIGLTVLGLLTIIFGYVLYQRLSKPVELDAEQYLAKSATTSASGEKKAASDASAISAAGDTITNLQTNSPQSATTPTRLPAQGGTRMATESSGGAYSLAGDSPASLEPRGVNAKSRYSASVAADDELGSGGNSASDESAGSASDLSGDPFTRPAGQANTASRGSSSFDPGEGAAAASFPAASPTRSTTDIPNASTIDSPSGTGYAPLNQSDSGGTSSELTTNHPPRENAATPYADELGNSPAYNDPAAGASKAITPLDHGLNSANEASPNAYATDDATPANPRALPGSAQNPMRLREIPSPLAPDDASQGNAATTSTADVAPRPLTSTTTADDTLPTEVGALEQAQNPAVLNNTSGPETSAYHSADSATNSALRQTTLTNESPLSPLQPLATSENSISHQQSSDIEPPSQPIRIPDAARELPPRSNMTVATGFAPANSTGVAAASPYVPRAGTPAFAATAEDSSSGSVSGIPNFTGNASTAPLSPSNGSDTQLSEPGRLRFSTPTAGIPPADKVSPPPGLDTGVNPNERDPAFTAQQLGYQAEGAISNQATTGSTNSTIPRSYVVQAQDSYYAIAERMYGNGAFYKALYEHNRRLQPGGDRLQPGGTLEIPAVDYLKANYAELLPSSAVNPTADRQPLIFHR